VKRAATDISTKVSNPLMINLIATLLVGIVTKSPLAQQPWLAWLQDATVAAALVTILGAVIGYSTEETAYREPH